MKKPTNNNRENGSSPPISKRKFLSLFDFFRSPQSNEAKAQSTKNSLSNPEMRQRRSGRKRRRKPKKEDTCNQYSGVDPKLVEYYTQSLRGMKKSLKKYPQYSNLQTIQEVDEEEDIEKYDEELESLV